MSVKEFKITSGPRRGVVLHVVEVNGREYNFDTAAEANEFDLAQWPKPLAGGKWLTSDNRAYTAAGKPKAVARQKYLSGKGKR
jgi:hypothetical protein